MHRKSLVWTAAFALGLLAGCGQSSGNPHAGGHEEAMATSSSAHGDHGENGHEASSGKLQADFAFASGKPEAGDEELLSIRIADERNVPVTKFQVNHEKLLHLIVVNRDLSFFSHIHPEYKGEGEFEVAAVFPSGGEYKIFADFIPEGGSATTLSEWVEVSGEEGSHADVVADSKLVRSANGKQVELALGEAASGRDVELKFTVRDGKTMEGVTDLEPYLGAVGHVVILSSDAEKYLHVHPADEKSTGPEATFETRFPESGTYKIWGQFKHDGQVMTVPFVVDVK